MVVRGDFLPRHLLGYFHLLFATLRCLYLAVWLYLVLPLNYDVIVVDQISFSIPILRRCSERLVFYCHFPDKLLAPQAKAASFLAAMWRKAYRWYFDRLEERTIGMATRVLVNSHFTGTRFRQAFPSLKTMTPQVLHPAINSKAYDSQWDPSSPVAAHLKQFEKRFLLSLNRFERKKNIELTIQTFLWLKDHIEDKKFSELKLVIAGGYDPRVRENIEYLTELQKICSKAGLSHFTSFPGQKCDIEDAQVLFLPSIPSDTRNYLMHNAMCLLYTPSFEHFGIVPVEAMYCGLPVVAVNNGGPRETVINNVTGFLCEARGASFGMAVQRLLNRTDADPTRMSVEARKHAKKEFSMIGFADKLESILSNGH